MNSQSAEQHNWSTIYDNHFLNEMSPTNHIFMLKLFNAPEELKS